MGCRIGMVVERQSGVPSGLGGGNASDELGLAEHGRTPATDERSQGGLLDKSACIVTEGEGSENWHSKWDDPSES